MKQSTKPTSFKKTGVTGALSTSFEPIEAHDEPDIEERQAIQNGVNKMWHQNERYKEVIVVLDEILGTLDNGRESPTDVDDSKSEWEGLVHSIHTAAQKYDECNARALLLAKEIQSLIG